jgi:peptide deformylase
MALRNIREYGDDVLARPCKEVKEITPRVRELVEDMLDTMYDANGVGLAAPQVGVLKRIVVIDVSPEADQPLVMINPKITSKKDRYETEEGCLSLSGMRKTVRFRTITVSYQDTQFQKHSQTFTGFTAQIIQHEIDHCGGILI